MHVGSVAGAAAFPDNGIPGASLGLANAHRSNSRLGNYRAPFNGNHGVPLKGVGVISGLFKMLL